MERQRYVLNVSALVLFTCCHLICLILHMIWIGEVRTLCDGQLMGEKCSELNDSLSRRNPSEFIPAVSVRLWMGISSQRPGSKPISDDDLDKALTLVLGFWSCEKYVFHVSVKSTNLLEQQFKLPHMKINTKLTEDLWFFFFYLL